jgi:hypothetical protein
MKVVDAALTILGGEPITEAEAEAGEANEPADDGGDDA